MTAAESRPVLILGAGINGCALARELLLNRVPVCLVDRADIASGTTAYSSRLVHGGLRYLEYGEFDLVRESLAERTRLLKLAPHLVRPLELFIPVTRGNRFGGVWLSAMRFLRRGAGGGTAKARGLWLVRMGLWLYDRFADDSRLPKHRVLHAGAKGAPPVDQQRYGWLCAYYDAQVEFPERLAIDFVKDCEQIAAASGVSFSLLTYHQAELVGSEVRLRRVAPGSASDAKAVGDVEHVIEPALIANASGPWVDRTLKGLHVESPRLLGGTKGSHFFTRHPRLKAELAGKAIYAEADDGRPVFVLPLADGTLVGTTDQRFEGAPEAAVASQAEIDYLLRLVGEILPDVRLTQADIAWHYSGVRPLPNTEGSTTASITRRHWLAENRGAPLPCYSLVGGKLTTCRSLAEEATHTILTRLGKTVIANSRERALPGAPSTPADARPTAQRMEELARPLGVTALQLAAVWNLCGAESLAILGQDPRGSAESLIDTELPLRYIAWVIAHEWVAALEDLVERRLMLLYQPRITRRTLEALALRLVEAGRLTDAAANDAIERTRDRLERHFGKTLD